MTIRESGDQAEDQRLVEKARKQFRRMSDALSGLIEKLEAGDTLPVAETERTYRDLMRVLNLTLEQEAKLADRRRKTAGVVQGPALDFDAARAEIRRRLACLSDAGSAG